MTGKQKRRNKELYAQHPYRKIDNLFVQRETFECASSAQSLCIPCAYKIAAFDIALDAEFTNVVPNTRPELCPRYNRTKGCDKGSSYGYRKGMKVLTVGDGDFSFSLALARILCSPTRTSSGTCTTKPKTNKSKTKRRKNEQKMSALQGSSTVVATSYESLETLKRVYPSITQTIDELKRLGCEVYYNVDATDLVGTLPIRGGDRDVDGDGHCPYYDRIAWNFPCTAEKNGQDGQNQQMADNRRLIKSFVGQCAKYLQPNNGEIHLLHKTKPPYDQWGIERVAVEDDKQWAKATEMTVAAVCPFEYRGRVVFDKCLLPPYTPRKALHKKSFTCHDACMYIFGWKLSQSDDEKKESKGHCDFEAMISSKTKTGSNDDADVSSANVIKVTKEMIGQIRSLHHREGSQIDRKKQRTGVK